MPVLQARYLVLPIQAFELTRSPDCIGGTHPSYKPTSSWTKSSASSGSKVGRRAVVRSRGWRNIQYHGFNKSAAFYLSPRSLMPPLSRLTESAAKLTILGLGLTHPVSGALFLSPLFKPHLYNNKPGPQPKYKSSTFDSVHIDVLPLLETFHLTSHHLFPLLQ